MNIRISVWLLSFLLLPFAWRCVSATGRGNDAGSVKGESVRYIVGLSPFLDNSVKDDVYRRLIAFLLEEMPLNSSLWLYDAFHLKTITQIDIPSVRAFQSSKTRGNQFKDQIRALKGFLAETHVKPNGTGLKFDQAVRFPQFMDFVGENLTGGSHSVVVVVIGGPLYVDDKEPAFSMADGYFPSDGHLMATREQSVFGLNAREEWLKGTVVHFGYFGDPWMSELHAEKIARFWTLYLKGQGARLATFCGDLQTVFNAVRSGDTGDVREQRHEIDRTQSKVQMLRIAREVGVTDWLTREIRPGAPQQPPSKSAGPMKVGIRWQGQLDLDLYAKPSRTAETLFFENTRTAEGYYFKDHRSSPDREYEFIEFESPVDIWQVDARINFYEGTSPGGARGEVRVEFDGRIFVGDFSLVADHGNQGRSGAGQQVFWTRIDIPALLRLRASASR